MRVGSGKQKPDGSGLPPLIGLLRLTQSESVGGRAHAPQFICFLWNRDGAAYRHGRTGAVSRYAIGERHWHPKVL
jgi:hypothetical protein